MTLATVDPVPVLVFDEIDAQIGGRLGTVIGEKLTELAALRQVILITHLPQIAAFGNAHFKITKSEIKGRTVTNAVVLDKKNRIAELAHMLCGKDNDPISLRHAEEMLSQSAR